MRAYSAAARAVPPIGTCYVQIHTALDTANGRKHGALRAALHSPVVIDGPAAARRRANDPGLSAIPQVEHVPTAQTVAQRQFPQLVHLNDVVVQLVGKASLTERAAIMEEPYREVPQALVAPLAIGVVHERHCNAYDRASTI